MAFQGCCESNPCNGVGCPSSDLRAAAVHTVDVAGSSTFTVPFSVATAGPTKTTSSAFATITSSQAVQTSKSTSPQVHTAVVAGGAAAAAVTLTLIVGLVYYCLMRKRRIKHLTEESLQHGSAPPDFKPFFKDPFGPGKTYASLIFTIYLTDSSTVVLTPLPLYSRRAASATSFGNPKVPFSPAPTYQSSHPPHTEPQEVMGFGLSEDEFDRRTKSRSPMNFLVDGPIELATQRFSANNPDVEAKSPLLESIARPQPKAKVKPKSRARREAKWDRQSRLRSRPAVVDLRTEASRSLSRGPIRSIESND